MATNAAMCESTASRMVATTFGSKAVFPKTLWSRGSWRIYARVLRCASVAMSYFLSSPAWPYRPHIYLLAFCFAQRLR